MIASEQIERVGRNVTHIHVQFPPEPLQKIFRQERNVVGPLTQGGQPHRERVQPKVKIGAELLLLHRLIEVAAGGGQDTDVDLDGLVSADAFKLAVLQHPQDLRLRRQGRVADLVEKQRAAVCLLEFSDPQSFGPGEGPFFVAE